MELDLPDIAKIVQFSGFPEINKVITDFCQNFLGKKPYLISRKAILNFPQNQSTSGDRNRFDV